MKKQMMKKLFSGIVALLLLAGVTPSTWAALTTLGDPPIAPHGYPAFYEDSTGLKLEICLPKSQDPSKPLGTSTRPDMCIFDPVNPANPDSVALGVGDESFWWMADANAPLLPGVSKGKALLVLGLEGAFGGVGTTKDGQQISFGRIRIRVDVPVLGAYKVYHPYSQDPLVFNVTDLKDGINYTEDIGAINFANPIIGFRGALSSKLGPFLRWPGYATDPSLQVRAIDPITGLTTGPVLEQYIGNPNIPHVVTGGPFRNIFRVEGPGGISTETDQFLVMGKVLDPALLNRAAHLYPGVPDKKLFAVGPVNQAAGFPIGFPIWYQDNAGTIAAPLAGLQLTICPSVDPMCISAPIDPADPASVALGVGEEAFWWSSEAFINDRTTDVTNLPAGLDGTLVLAVEAAFGGTGAPKAGNQIAFGRLRIRVDVPTPGTYTITHPYGVEVFANVTVADGINFTEDVGMINLADPDGAFAGALYGDIGPRFLTWPNYADSTVPGNGVLKKQPDPNDPTKIVQYIGDPATPHAVTGSPNGTNFFRIQGPNGIDVETKLFATTGKLFGPGTFQNIPDPTPDPTIPVAPVANPDTATLNLAQTASVTIPVRANDTFGQDAVTISVVTPPASGTATISNAAGTITYTPSTGFAATGGVDTFTYNITSTVSGLTSNNAVVTVNVIPVETITVSKARLDLRRLQYEIRGTSNIEGATLTIYPGATATGDSIGTAVVQNGRWSLRTTATSNANSISIVSSNGKTLNNQTLQVR